MVDNKLISILEKEKDYKALAKLCRQINESFQETYDVYVKPHKPKRNGFLFKEEMKLEDLRKVKDYLLLKFDFSDYPDFFVSKKEAEEHASVLLETTIVQYAAMDSVKIVNKESKGYKVSIIKADGTDYISLERSSGHTQADTSMFE